MHQWTLRTLALATLLIVTEAPAFAQMGMPGMGGGMPGMGGGTPGMGGGIPGTGGGMPQRRHKPKLKRNSSPVLSPALNLLPEASTTFEGQFLMRQLPQEQLNRSVSQNAVAFDRLENQIDQQEKEVRSGLGKTGHSARFMNYGSYYSRRGTAAGGSGR